MFAQGKPKIAQATTGYQPSGSLPYHRGTDRDTAYEKPSPKATSESEVRGHLRKVHVSGDRWTARG